MDFSDSSGELPLSRLCSPNRTSASCPSLPRYQAACVSILCGSARAVARITCAADSGGGTRERISLRPPDHSPWHDAITQQSGRFTGEPEVTELSGRRRRACALASVRRSNCTYGFTVCSFHEDASLRDAREGINPTKFTSSCSPYSVALRSCVQPPLRQRLNRCDQIRRTIHRSS